MAMQVDYAVYKNDTYWWLWGLYTVGINTADVIMVLALIIDKDFLKLVWFYKKLKLMDNQIRR
jgi:hypothetical protein